MAKKSESQEAFKASKISLPPINLPTTKPRLSDATNCGGGGEQDGGHMHNDFLTKALMVKNQDHEWHQNHAATNA
jgi:hypothetical protein